LALSAVLALDFAGLVTISQGKALDGRRHPADQFGAVAYQLFWHGVIDPELNLGLSRPPVLKT
jgi:hypothetical protein